MKNKNIHGEEQTKEKENCRPRKTGRVKRLLCLVLTVAFSFGFYSYICSILTPKNSAEIGRNNYFMGRGFKGEPKKDSLDVIVFGNSNVYSGISPSKLYEEYGYTSYASGVAWQTVGKIDKILLDAVRCQKPKIAVLDADCLYTDKEQPFDGYNFFLTPFVFHYRWKHLKKADFYQFPKRYKTYDITKGFVYSDKVSVLTPGDYMGAKDAAPKRISHKNLRNMKKFFYICKENGIMPLVIQLPTVSTWNYEKHNYIASVTQSEGVSFIDFNAADTGYKADYQTEFRDGMHLNVKGAERVTVQLGGIFAKMCPSLSDKRNDKEYAYWNEAIKFYEGQKKKQTV